MIERIIIGENIRFSTCIIWRVNINQFDLSSELLFESMECNEVIAFDDKVFADRAVVVAFNVRYVLFTCGGVAFPAGKHLWIKHPIDFVLCKDFVEENLFTFLLFLCLSAFKHAIFVGPTQVQLRRVHGETYRQCSSRFCYGTAYKNWQGSFLR